MLTRKNSINGKNPFEEAAELFQTLDPDAAMKLAMVAGDIIVILDKDGIIMGSTFDPEDFPDFEAWEGSAWIDTVTAESQIKISEMLNAAERGEVQHWRQVNHPSGSGDVPVRYAVLAINRGKHRIAIGRDLRDVGRMQQRLLQVQQSLERDYLRMRQLDRQYRLLFEQAGDPIMIVEAPSLRIAEANGAVHAIMGVREGSLPGKRLPSLIEKGSRNALQSLVGASLSARSAVPKRITLTKGSTAVVASVNSFVQSREQFLLFRLNPETGPAPSQDMAHLDLIEQMPDAFVMATSDYEIVYANAAFAELAGLASADQMVGRNLANWLGRPGVDLELIEAQISEHGAARNVATVVRESDAIEPEPVELSGARGEGENGLYAFVVRPIARRVRDLPPCAHDMPRSVNQLTELVGRMPLKDIVGESTDLIERLCIEAALERTDDNKASAAEILGLSRQSLYSKMRRHGLGNLPMDGE